MKHRKTQISWSESLISTFSTIRVQPIVKREIRVADRQNPQCPRFVWEALQTANFARQGGCFRVVPEIDGKHRKTRF